MKHFCLILIALMMIGLCSCNSESNKTYTTTPCSKEDVDAFCDILGEGLLSGYVLDREKCFNVTPQQVLGETNCKIFKFSDSAASFVMIDNEVYTLCEWFGGYGFVNAVPCDFDKDGNKDLLVASSWGSGLHRSVISVFNSVTKESTVIYDTSTTDNPQIDLFVAVISPSFSSEDPSDLPVTYQVYSAEIKSSDNNFANLSYAVTGIVGSISNENGVIAFIPTEET